MSEASVKIVLVGHCGPDSYALKNAVRRAVTTAEVVMVSSDRELGLHTDAALLLVNRALDGEFSAETGIDLIRSLNAGGVRAPTMLVSNFEEAQNEAVAAGALAGFGKREMGSETTAMKIRNAATTGQKR